MGIRNQLMKIARRLIPVMLHSRWLRRAWLGLRPVLNTAVKPSIVIKVPDGIAKDRIHTLRAKFLDNGIDVVLKMRSLCMIRVRKFRARQLLAAFLQYTDFFPPRVEFFRIQNNGFAFYKIISFSQIKDDMGI